MSVAIVTDSAAALPPDLVTRYGITVVPMWIALDGRSVRENEIPLSELLAHGDVTTSGPAPGEFESAIAQRQSPAGVCVLTIAATMSSTYEAAVIGARTTRQHVQVVDTRTAAGAQALVVLAAAEAAARGATLEEVVATAGTAVEQVRLVASVPNLDHLVRSGRVPNIAGRAGRALGLAPLFEFRDGGAHALRPARGLEAALDRIAARCRREAVPGAQLQLAALHAQAPEAAAGLLPSLHDGTGGLVAGGLIFFALGVILARVGQKKIA